MSTTGFGDIHSSRWSIFFFFFKLMYQLKSKLKVCRYCCDNPNAFKCPLHYGDFCAWIGAIIQYASLKGRKQEEKRFFFFFLNSIKKKKNE